MEIVGVCYSSVHLRDRVLMHYRTQLLQQLHVLLLGVHVLATPTARLATRTTASQVKNIKKSLLLQNIQTMRIRWVLDESFSTLSYYFHLVWQKKYVLFPYLVSSITSIF